MQNKTISRISMAPMIMICGLLASGATAEDCANLAKLGIGNTTLTSVSLIPAGGTLPEYCRVQGRVDAEIGFEVRLPTTWNGKFYFQGGTGFVGSIAAAGP